MSVFLVVGDWLILNRRTIGLLLALGGGALAPQAASLSFLIKFLIAIMLFFAFLDLEFDARSINSTSFSLIAANLVIAGVTYLLLSPLDEVLGLAAFMAAISPTATAAPVVVKLLRGKVDFVVGSVLLSNVIIAFTLSLYGFFLLPRAVGHSVWTPTFSVLAVVLLPLGIAYCIRRVLPRLATMMRRFQWASFYVWLVVIFLAVASATSVLFGSGQESAWLVAAIGIATLVICIANFSIGYRLGGSTLALEASQALGQKNTMLTIWFSIAFLPPMVVIGPTFYVLFHNLYNSYQLASFRDASLPET